MTNATTLPADRLGRREVTRRRICSAANGVFLKNGFHGATMEEIARGAAIRRSTLYTHFRDKDEILAAIAADYLEDIEQLIARLPGPRPNQETVCAWIAELAASVAARPGPVELLVATGTLSEVPPASVAYGEALMRAFSRRLDAFARALEPDEGFLLAWATATLSELGAALTLRVRWGDVPAARDRLDVAAMLFGRFVRAER